MTAKIVLVGPLPPPNHGQSLSFQMLSEALKNNYEVEVIDIADSKIEGKRDKLGTFKRCISYVSILSKFLLSLIRRDCRVYITISQSLYGFVRDFFMIWMCVVLGRKVVVHLKGGNYGNFYEAQSDFTKFLIRSTLNRVERILVLGKRLVSMYNFDPRLREKIYIVENGLPFEDAAETPKTIDTSKPLEILFLSNMVESKGYFDILAAVSILKKKGVSINCHFAGEFYTNADDVIVNSIEHAKSLFEKKVKDYRLEDIVEYHGSVSGVKKIELFKKSHIFILPTNYNNEGQPVSIIEAMSFGLPIISTDYRAIPDMVIDNRTGFFVDYGNSSDIAAAVVKLLENDNYERISKECISYYKDKFTTQAHLSRIKPHILGGSREIRNV